MATSTRAIADTLNVSKDTVARALGKAGVKPAATKGLDGKTYGKPGVSSGVSHETPENSGKPESNQEITNLEVPGSPAPGRKRLWEQGVSSTVSRETVENSGNLRQKPRLRNRKSREIPLPLSVQKKTGRGLSRARGLCIM